MKLYLNHTERSPVEQLQMQLFHGSMRQMQMPVVNGMKAAAE